MSAKGYRGGFNPFRKSGKFATANGADASSDAGASDWANQLGVKNEHIGATGHAEVNAAIRAAAGAPASLEQLRARGMAIQDAREANALAHPLDDPRRQADLLWSIGWTRQKLADAPLQGETPEEDDRYRYRISTGRGYPGAQIGMPLPAGVLIPHGADAYGTAPNQGFVFRAENFPDERTFHNFTLGSARRKRGVGLDAPLPAEPVGMGLQANGKMYPFTRSDVLGADVLGVLNGIRRERPDLDDTGALDELNRRLDAAEVTPRARRRYANATITVDGQPVKFVEEPY